jgi:hypothetical protein
VLSTGALAGVRFELYHANDLATPSPFRDDLYTATLGVMVQVERLRFRLGENMFTDRTNGIRFDETYVSSELAFRPRAGFEVGAEVGLLRVGEGLMGQSFQNWVHRLIDEEEVFLDYVDDVELHATLRAELVRPFSLGSDATIGPRVELYEAFGFKRHAIAGAVTEWHVTPRVWILGELAARYTETDYDPLEPWIVSWAPSGEVGIRTPSLLGLTYRYNADGEGVTRPRARAFRHRMLRVGMLAAPAVVAAAPTPDAPSHHVEVRRVRVGVMLEERRPAVATGSMPRRSR